MWAKDFRAYVLLAAAVAATVATPTAGAGADSSVSEMPAHFAPRVDAFDYTKRVVMIAMRDGVKLETVILVPRGAQRAPMLLTRTPYGAAARTAQNTSAHLAAVLDSTDVADEAVVEGGYIRVLQDVRGKHGSEGDYVMNRPLRGAQNSTGVDHATDTYDTIDWLVKNVPESNGRVGILGISYDGFTALMALVHPHPALRAAVPINAMVDGWMGDDWFHKGAFRQPSLTYIHDQEATRGSDVAWWSDHYDDYDTWLAAGSAGNMARLHGLEQTGFATKVMQHPAYDAFWQDQAVDRILAREGVTVPVMLVHSLWDQEDIYGNVAVYKALQASRTTGGSTTVAAGAGPSAARLTTTGRRRCISCSARGTTTRSGWTAAASAPSSSAATRRSISGGSCCGRSWIIFSGTIRRRSTWRR